MSNEQKIEKFKAGRWVVASPPVTTNQWSDQNWVDYINNNGQWAQ
jgi:hypothetical protein